MKPLHTLWRRKKSLWPERPGRESGERETMRERTGKKKKKETCRRPYSVITGSVFGLPVRPLSGSCG